MVALSFSAEIQSGGRHVPRSFRAITEPLDNYRGLEKARGLTAVELLAEARISGRRAFRTIDFSKSICAGELNNASRSKDFNQ